MPTPNPTPAFFVEDTGDSMVWLRRWKGGHCAPGGGFGRGHHSARYIIGPVVGEVVNTSDVGEYAGHPGWPTQCDGCDYVFDVGDHWQIASDSIMVRRDTGQMWPLRDLPAGAMYDATWYPWKGPDGMSLVVMCPPDGCQNGWPVDGPARKDGIDKPGAWTRTGDPRAVPPTITVTPSIEIGFSIDAAGQWIQGGPCYYHGFLQGGVLTPG